jgi:hypothetical protein
MADFCNKCAAEMWNDQVEPEIDVHGIADQLEPGYFESVLCEGCGIRAIGKNDNGEILIAILEEEGHIEDMVKWVSLETWLAEETSI